MSTATIQYLSKRLLKADRRWDAAMNREGYRDDPDEADEEGNPFTEIEWGLYGWADSWRLMVHRIENAIELHQKPPTFELRRIRLCLLTRRISRPSSPLSTSQKVRSKHALKTNDEDHQEKEMIDRTLPPRTVHRPPEAEAEKAPVTKPNYYRFSIRGQSIDVTDVIQALDLGFEAGNVVKYIARAGRKDAKTEVEDLKKAREYIDRLIEFRTTAPL